MSSGAAEEVLLAAVVAIAGAAVGCGARLTGVGDSTMTMGDRGNSASAKMA